MNECARFEAMLDAPTPEALAHYAGCESCRDLLALHRELEELGETAEEPSEEAFSAMSARVLASAGGASRTAPRVPAWGYAAALAASVLIFAGGLLFGRALMRGGTGTPRLVAAIGAEAASNRDLADVENSRFTYSNVSLRSAGPDRVLLDFDVTTHVRLEEPVGSELAREAIVQALLDRSSTGARLRALSYAGSSLEPKVREAMILSLRSDPSLAVRLKALELLADHLRQSDVKEAVLATLRDDDSVQMRLLALDALAAHRVDRDLIRDVIHEGARPGDEALLVRLAEIPPHN
ncbi:MAG TPA: hypothetical protein VJS92_14360 [Candidatus Polarisedimenticolaceae bacterium]|nr:hypothetical protein [Candidatus Polarisedimenticolaceae bacterium]